MGIVKTRSKTLAEGSSSTPAPDTKDPDDKRLQETAQSRCRDHGGGSRSGLDGSVVENKENGGDSGQGLDDSEIKGASSLLKMRESLEETEDKDSGIGVKENEDEYVDENGEDPDGEIMTINVPIEEDTSKNKDGENTGLSENKVEEFSVGDFVWGKIKSHPWWPGRVYNLFDASDSALKSKQKNNRLLVAHFGDGTFSWCQPSQLKLFEENFEEMSRQSNSKSFVNAVDNALDEIGRILKFKMTCSCVPEANRKNVSREFALNAGIKEGVLVPESGIEKFSALISEPTAILDELKHIACRNSVTSLLEFRMLKSKLSAFYSAKGGYELPSFRDPTQVPGLEDFDHESQISKFNGAVTVPVRGPFDEDWPFSPLSPKFDQTRKPDPENTQVTTGDRLYQRRKVKSIADILKAHTESEDMPTRSSKRRKKKGSNRETDAPCVDKLASSEIKKRKMEQLGTPLHGDIQVTSVENGGSERDEENKKRSLTRGRKKIDSGGEDEIKISSLSTEKRMKSNSVRYDGAKANAQSAKRERKKSKYLSPPFTNFHESRRKRDIESQSLEDSKNASLAERMSKAASNLIGSPRISKGETKISPDLKHEESERPVPQTPEENENKKIDPINVNAAADQVLRKFRSVAINPIFPWKSLEPVGAFLGTFRSSVYRDGSSYKEYKECRSGRKRKKLESEHGSLGKDQNKTTEPKTEKVQKKKKNKETKPDTKTKQDGGTLDVKSSKSKSKKVEKSQSGM